MRFFVNDGLPLNVVGGYNFNTRRIEIIVKWSFGIEAINGIFDSQLPLLCNKIFALILSEALLIYDYKHNGELSSSDSVKQWYKVYFSNMFDNTLHRSNLSQQLSDVVSDNYGSRIFERVEKSIIEGKSPAIKIEYKGLNPELDIEGIPSIKKGNKQLEDIFGDCIEDYVNEFRSNFNIDHIGYQDLKELWSNFAELGAFLYKNRDLPLDPRNIAAEPTGPLDMYEYKNYDKVKYNETLKQQKQDEDEKKDREYEDFLKKNKLDSIIQTADQLKLQDKQAKYFNDFSSYGTYTRRLPDGRRIPMLPGQFADKKDYITDTDNYIKHYLMNCSNPSFQDIETAIQGNREAIENCRQSYRKLVALENSNNPDQNRLNLLRSIYQNTFNEAQSISRSFWEWMRQLTNNTPDSNESRFFTQKFNIADMDQAWDNAQTLMQRERAVQSSESTFASATMGQLMDRRDISRRELQMSQVANQLAEIHQLINNQNNPLSANQIQNLRREEVNLARQLQNLHNQSNLGSIRQNNAYNIYNRYGSRTLTSGVYNNNIVNHNNNDSDSVLSMDSTFNANNNMDINNNLDIIATSLVRMKHVGNGLLEDVNNHRLPIDQQDARNRGLGTNIFFNNQVRPNNNPGLLTSASQLSTINIPGIRNNIPYTPNNIEADIITTIRDIRNYLNNELINEQARLGRRLSTTEVDAFKRQTLNNIIQSVITNDNKRHFNNIKNALFTYTKNIYGFDRSASPNTIINYQQNIPSTRPTAINNRLNGDMANNLLPVIINNELTPEQYEALMHNQGVLVTNGGERSTLFPLHVLNNIGKERILNNNEKYFRTLFTRGLSYLINSMPSWETIKEYAREGFIKTQDIYRFFKNLYKFTKILLPLESNMKPYMNQKFGFGKPADPNYFDLAYKLTYKIKKMYELHKGTVRQNMVYSELYMPVTILQKVLYAHLVTQNDFTPEILYLLNCSNKGLEEFL